MIATVTTIFTLLTSGAGGGILGGVFGLFKQRGERKERAEMEKLAIRRDMMEYRNASAERRHALQMMEMGAQIELEKVQSETDAEIEIANQQALSSAQDALKNLKTTSGMDNYRASVRPTIAYWATILFTTMIAWAFYKFSPTIDQDTGKQILLGMFATLTFVVTSVTTFYYVSRRNSAPKG